MEIAVYHQSVAACMVLCNQIERSQQFIFKSDILILHRLQSKGLGYEPSSWRRDLFFSFRVFLNVKIYIKYNLYRGFINICGHLFSWNQ